MAFGFLKILIIAMLSLATMAAAAQNRSVAMTSPMVTYDSDIMRQLPPPTGSSNVMRDDGSKFPTLWVGSVRWDQSHRTIKYKVDSSLSASALYHYNFQIFPELHSGKGQSQTLDSGYYLMRMVVLRPLDAGEEATVLSELGSLKPDYLLYRRFVTSVEQVVEVSRGSIRAEVQMEFPAISAISMRNTLLIQFLPVKTQGLRFAADGKLSRDSKIEVDPSPAYAATVIKMPFIPRTGSGFATPPPPTFTDEASLEDSLDLGSFIRMSKMYTQALRYKLLKPLSPRAFADRMKLTYYVSSSPHLASQISVPNQRGSITAPHLLAKLQNLRPLDSELSEDYVESICRLLTNETGVDSRILGHGELNQKRNRASFKQLALNRCLLDPDHAFELIRTWHVSSLGANEPEHIRGAPTHLGLSFNFGTNRQHAIDAFTSLSGGANLSGFLPTNLKGIVSFGWAWSVNESNSRSKFEGAILSGSTNLDVHEWDLKFELKEYTSCTMIVRRPQHVAWSFVDTKSSPENNRGIYICFPGVERRPVQTVERYYHVQPSPTSISGIDIYDPKNQIANMVVRSQRDYSFFLKSIRQFLVPTNTEKRTSGEDIKIQAEAYKTAVPSMLGVKANGVFFTGPKADQRRAKENRSGFYSRVVDRRPETFN